MIDSTPTPTPTSGGSSAGDTARPAAVPRFDRRRFLRGGALAVGAGVVLAAGFGDRRSRANAQFRADELNQPGNALQPAERVTEIPLIEPPADGEILFPIEVGPDDSCWVFDSFGDCRGTSCSRLHEGVDMMADHGLPVRAVADGVLTKRYVDSGLTYGAGNGWTLDDANDDIVWKFFHLDRHADGLEVGSEVRQGQIIGYVGNTGTSGAHSDTNYHLHFEYRPGNVATDSFPLLQRAPYVTFAD